MSRAEKGHRVGDAIVTRIPELETWDLAPTDLLPAWDPAVVEPYVDEFVPRCLAADGSRVAVSTHSWLVRTPKNVVLIDTAIGNGKSRRMPLFDHLDEPYLDRLAAAGVVPHDVDHVLITHLHIDHVGWNTRLVEGIWMPTFPKARYVMSRPERERWAELAAEPSADGPDAAFYEDSIAPVLGRTDFVGPDGGEPVDGFAFVPTPGHSVNHMSIELVSAGERGFFAGDVMHHPAQVRVPSWSSVFSEDPDRGRTSREWALAHVAETGSTVFTSHFPSSSAGRVERIGAGFRWRFAD